MTRQGVQGPNGGDATKSILTALEAEMKEVAGEAITIWNTAAQERLTEAAEQRSGIDAKRDQRGSLEGREQNVLHAITQSFTAPAWNATEEAWEFSVTHAGAIYAEWGALPHEIEVAEAEALAFQWPDAPEEIRERFNFDDPTADDYEMVFFDSVDHPGVPAIGFMRYGRQQAEQRMKAAGFTGRQTGLETTGPEGDD